MVWGSTEMKPSKIQPQSISVSCRHEFNILVKQFKTIFECVAAEEEMLRV